MIEDVQFPPVELPEILFDVREDHVQAFWKVPLQTHPGNYKASVAEDHHHV
jgi:hypothetical protein